MNDRCSNTTAGVQCPLYLSIVGAWKCTWHLFETQYHQDFDEFKMWRDNSRHNLFGENSQVYCFANLDKTFWLMEDQFIFDSLRGFSIELMGNVELKTPVTEDMFVQECKEFRSEFLMKCQAEVDRYVKENPDWRSNPKAAWQNFEFKTMDEVLGKSEKKDDLPF